MKKALAMGLGALLVAGSAAPASAASQIDFSGYYNLYFTNVWGQNSNTTNTGVTAWSGFTNRLNLDFAFHATDEVSVFWRLRAPGSQKWGAAANDPDSSGGVETYYAYGQIKQDWGTVLIGKLPDANFYTGLSNLGWRPDGPDGSGWFTAVNPFDIADSAYDGIRYANRWDNGFQLVGQFNRLGTAQTNFGPDWNPANAVNGDEDFFDFYLLEGGYFWDGGGATLGVHYMRDGIVGELRPDPTDTYTGAGVRGPHDPDANRKAWYINPAFAHRLDNGFGFHFEGKYGSGKFGDEKATGYAAYLDVDYNYGPGNINLAGWYATGDDGTNTDDKDFVGMGGEFKPLLVAYGNNAGHRGRSAIGGAVAQAQRNSGVPNHGFGAFGEGDVSNHWAVALSGNHAFTDDISLSYAIAKLSLLEVQQGADKDIGFEVDLGLQFQLLDNVKLGSAVGYLFAGDALKYQGGDTADSVAWLSTLTFSF